MSRKKKKPDKQQENSLPEKKHDASHLARWRFKPGQSGNPNGRPPDELTIVARTKELLDLPAPRALVDELKRQNAVPEEWIQNGRELTWRDCASIRNMFKATSPRGDFMMKVVWEMIEGKPTIRIEDGGGGPTSPQIDLSKLTVEQIREIRDAKLRIQRVLQTVVIDQAREVEEK